MAVGALATAARALAAEDPPLAAAFPVDGAPPRAYLAAAQAAAGAVRGRLWDARAHRLKRSFCRSTSAVDAFADDCAHPRAVAPRPCACGRAASARAWCRAARWPCAAAGARWASRRLCAAPLPKPTAQPSVVIPSTNKATDQILASSPPNGKRSSTPAGWYRQSFVRLQRTQAVPCHALRLSDAPAAEPRCCD